MLAQIAALLNSTIGLDAKVVGMPAIARAVSVRQKACGDGLPAYWERLSGSEQERQELIEEVIVPETWFFREDAALAALVQVAQQHFLSHGAHRKLRALSLPCATGEEPYSMAMALLDAGIPPHRFHIDGIDISAQALRKAHAAVYGRNAFRGRDAGFRDRYFTETEQGCRLAHEVAQTVSFRHGNIFDDSTLPAGRYDAVFLRNVLIYFGPAQRAQAIATALRLLKDDGVLFVGTAEAALLRAHGLVPFGSPKACGFQRAREAAAPPPRSRPKKKSALPPPATQGVAVRAALPPAVAAPATPTHAPVAADSEAAGAAMLDEAAELADRGQLERAGALCEQYLASHPPSTQALSLLGLIRDARGQSQQAADFYRKVLYLDPHHAEALAHLAALLDRQGLADEAQRLRRRYERAASRNGR